MQPRSWERPARKKLLGVCAGIAARKGKDVDTLRWLFAVPCLAAPFTAWYALSHLGPCTGVAFGQMVFALTVTAAGLLSAGVYLACALLLPKSASTAELE